jgi:hypothetical protein
MLTASTRPSLHLLRPANPNSRAAKPRAPAPQTRAAAQQQSPPPRSSNQSSRAAAKPTAPVRQTRTAAQQSPAPPLPKPEQPCSGKAHRLRSAKPRRPSCKPQAKVRTELSGSTAREQWSSGSPASAWSQARTGDTGRINRASDRASHPLRPSTTLLPVGVAVSDTRPHPGPRRPSAESPSTLPAEAARHAAGAGQTPCRAAGPAENGRRPNRVPDARRPASDLRPPPACRSIKLGLLNAARISYLHEVIRTTRQSIVVM